MYLLSVYCEGLFPYSTIVKSDFIDEIVSRRGTLYWGRQCYHGTRYLKPHRVIELRFRGCNTVQIRMHTKTFNKCIRFVSITNVSFSLFFYAEIVEKKIYFTI